MKIHFNKIDALKVIAPLIVYYAFMWLCFELIRRELIQAPYIILRLMILISVIIGCLHLFRQEPVSMVDMCLLGLLTPFIAAGGIYLVWCFMNINFMPINTENLTHVFLSSGISALALPALNLWGKHAHTL